MVGVLEREKIAYFGVHKAAGTTVKNALFQVQEGRAWQPSDGPLHPKFPSIPVKPEDFDRYRGYWTFTVIRDPVRRFLSAYQNRVLDHKDLTIQSNLKSDKSVAGRLRKLVGSYHPFPGFERQPSIENLIKHYADYCRISTHIYVHTCPSKEFIGDDLSYFDEVYTTADLDRLARDLTARTGQAISFEHHNKSASRPPKFEDLSQADQNFLIDHTQEDYALFKDYFSPPTLSPAVAEGTV